MKIIVFKCLFNLINLFILIKLFNIFLFVYIFSYYITLMYTTYLDIEDIDREDLKNKYLKLVED